MRRRQEETNPASPTFPLKSTLIVVFVLRLDCPYHQQIVIRDRAELPSYLITHCHKILSITAVHAHSAITYCPFNISTPLSL